MLIIPCWNTNLLPLRSSILPVWRQQPSARIPEAVDDARTARRAGPCGRGVRLGPQQQNVHIQRHHVLEVWRRNWPDGAGLPSGHPVCMARCGIQHRRGVPMARRWVKPIIYKLCDLQRIIIFCTYCWGQHCWANETLLPFSIRVPNALLLNFIVYCWARAGIEPPI